MRHLSVAILIVVMNGAVLSQSQFIILKGRVIDALTQRPLKEANCTLVEKNKSVITDEQGWFQFELLSSNEFHLSISHQGCESEIFHISIVSDTQMTFHLHHYHKHLKEVLVKGGKNALVETISGVELDTRAKENLSQLLEKTGNTRTLKTGSGIAKPIIHGLYGNRLTILNQGVAQAGQQWGNDHAPEIDPLAGNKIRVIKGVSALEYKGINMGALISIEPQRFKNDPHIHGKINSFYESNGYGLGTNIQLEQKTLSLAWRATGTYKNFGDKYTPTYYLKNTGAREINFSFMAEKYLFDNWNTTLYLSTFNSELGILRGSHISNLTDLNEAMNRTIPFFTEVSFKREINPPKQFVQHHLWKINSQKKLDSFNSLSFMYSGQINQRKEFDIRRGGRSDIPVLYLFQHSHFFETKWIKSTEGNTFKSGIQIQYTENINQPETGITPLIPNYSTIEPSLFLTYAIHYPKSSLELGIRGDIQSLNIYTTTKTIPKEPIQLYHLFANASSSLSYTYRLNEKTNVYFNTGFALRNPAINELYSFGLHQGVASIEEGNPLLISEKSFKTILSIQNTWSDNFSTQVQSYFHNINDFIFLRPLNQPRLTIRGAYPVFVYDQTHAQIYGIDASLNIKAMEGIDFTSAYSFLKGINLSDDLPLIYMPSNQWRNGVEFSKTKLGRFENPTLTLSGNYTFRQSNLKDNQDFIPAPDGYFLLGGKFSLEKQVKSYRFLFYTQIENVMNIKYRDYLNRLRYFADELGRNITIGIVINR